MRIGDKQTDKLVIPGDYSEKIIRVEKYCTKPELEILLIIAEGLLADFTKSKSSIAPKAYAKAHISCGRHKYDNSTMFYREYFGNSPDLLVSAIMEYRKIHGSHKKDELFLADLLK